MKIKRLISFTPEQLRWLKMVSKKKDVSVSELTRNGVELLREKFARVVR